MGYVTRFDLQITKNGKDAFEEFRSLIELGRKYDSMKEEELECFKPEYVAKLLNASQALEEISDLKEELGYFLQGLKNCDEMKWYDHEDDMRRISAAFPDFLFKLSGEGEEKTDVWTKWFLNSKMQGGMAQIVMPEFDPKGFK